MCVCVCVNERIITKSIFESTLGVKRAKSRRVSNEKSLKKKKKTKKHQDYGVESYRGFSAIRWTNELYYTSRGRINRNIRIQRVREGESRASDTSARVIVRAIHFSPFPRDGATRVCRRAISKTSLLSFPLPLLRPDAHTWEISNNLPGRFALEIPSVISNSAVFARRAPSTFLSLALSRAERCRNARGL